MTLRVGVFRQPPYVSKCIFERSGVPSLAADRTNCTSPGVSAEILQVILAVMQVKYELVLFDREPVFGARNETTGEWNGIESLLSNGTLHLLTAFGGSAYLSEAHGQDFVYSWPLLFCRDAVIVRLGDYTSIGANAILQLTRMFQWQVWGACAVAFATSLIAHAVSHLSPLANRVATTGTFVAILMLPLYGSVLAVQLAVPRAGALAYENMADLVVSGKTKLIVSPSSLTARRVINQMSNGATKTVVYKGMRVSVDNILVEEDVDQVLMLIAQGEGIAIQSNIQAGAGITATRLGHVLQQVDTPEIRYTSSIFVRKDNTRLFKELNMAILLCYEQLRRVKEKYGMALDSDGTTTSGTRI